ncbi:MAG: hypothetical protein DRO52_03900 [Candidatus Hecatellales archaeon]|nr:MAG: hypothetical protein DRO52_03900 [Candidatus Hecatellales archaeon]
MSVKILGVIPLSAVKSFGTFSIQFLNLLLITDTGILILKDACGLKGLEEAFPMSQERLRELFKRLPKSSKEFREYIYSVVGSSISLDRLAERLGRKFSSSCMAISYRDIIRLGIRRRKVHMIVAKATIIEVIVDTEKKSHRFIVLPGSYRDITEDAAYAEVLDMLRKTKLPITILHD